MGNIIKANAEYTGGGIWAFTGKFEDGTYFMADGFDFGVRIVNANPDDVEDGGAWYVEWQEEHLVRDLDTETEGPSFILSIVDWLRENGRPGVCDSDLEYIEEHAKQYVGKKGWLYNGKD